MDPQDISDNPFGGMSVITNIQPEESDNDFNVQFDSNESPARVNAPEEANTNAITPGTDDHLRPEQSSDDEQQENRSYQDEGMDDNKYVIDLS